MFEAGRVGWLVVGVIAFCLVFGLGGGFAVFGAGEEMTEAEGLYAYHGFQYEEPVINDVEAGDFLIMPWGWTPGDEGVLEDIKDCGFNVAGFMAPEYVEVARKVGIQCIVDDPRISKHVLTEEMSDEEIARRVGEAVAKFKGDPAVFGYYVMDEPVAPVFANLARWSRAIRQADGEAAVYINLHSMVARELGAKDYEEYVGRFLEEVDPTYISYDHYALKDDGSVAETLYLNLSTMRKASLEREIPFWNIVLANGHFRYASPTQGGINLQVYATLAYGGRGISYFTYFAPLIGNYRDAAVDQFMHKTPTWDMLRLINLQIRQLCPTYLKLKSVNVFHHPEVPAGENGLAGSRHLSEVTGRNLLVGEFEDGDGKPFVLIVNKDIRLSTHFNVKFKEEGRIMQTNAYTGKAGEWGRENNWLAPGTGMLLSLEK